MDQNVPMLSMDDEPTLSAIVAADPAISAYSRWSASIWHLDGENGGQNQTRFAIHWTVKAPPLLLDEAKFLAARLFLPREGDVQLKHTTASTFSSGMRHLLRFMANYSYGSFDQLDEDAFSLFRDNLAVKLSDPEWWTEEFSDSFDLEEDDDQIDAEEPFPEDDAGRSDLEARDAAPAAGKSDGFTRAAAYNRLRTWRQLHQHADAMRNAGCRSLTYDAYATISLRERTLKASSIATFLIPPLPDKVALRIMAVAQSLLGAPAEDVIELQSRYTGCMARLDREPTTRERQAIRAVMEGFAFSEVERRPWREPIVLSETQPGGGVAMKELVSLIRDAAVLVVFCGTGVRIGELCSLTADPRVRDADLPLFGATATDDASDLPHCVSTAISKTGLNEHLFMHARLFKNERTPRDERWLIGARPRGSDVEPPVLRALCILERLYAPWRPISKDERTRSHLILGLHGSGLPRSTRGLKPIQAGDLRRSIRDFIAERCGLEDLETEIDEDRRLRPYVTSRGACIRPHQWRKTFALYMMKVDDRMVPALAHHFKHMSIAVTEDSYMPSDPSMLAAGESVHAQEAARWMYEQRHGAGGSFGILDEIMAEHRAEWEKLVDDLPFEGGIPAVMRFCLDRDIRIFHSEHGRCVIGINPDRARCHADAGTSSWRNTTPNYATRTPGTCVGCSNFSVSGEHAGFWRRRFVSHQESWLRSDRSTQFRVVQKRAQQAAAVLKALGVTLPVILVEAPADRAARKSGRTAPPKIAKGAANDGQGEAA